MAVAGKDSKCDEYQLLFTNIDKTSMILVFRFRKNRSAQIQNFKTLEYFVTKTCKKYCQEEDFGFKSITK
jgi:hypothetical protein